MKPRSKPRLLLLASVAGVAVTIAALASCVGDDPSLARVDTAPESGADGGGAPDGADGAAVPDAAETDAADAGPWTPDELDQANNLAVWLEPSSASFVMSNGTVGIWKDRSKNKNDAKNTATGPTISAALVNGHDTVHFSQNVTLSIDDAATLRFADHQFYVIAVARLVSGAGTGYFYSKASTAVSAGAPSYATGFEFFASPGDTDAGTTALFPSARIRPTSNEVSWSDAVFDDNKFHLVAARRLTSFRLALTVDDQAAREASTGAFDVSEVGNPVTLGALKYGTFNPPVDFDVAEVIVVHGASAIVADDDVANLRAYLKKKYAL